MIRIWCDSRVCVIVDMRSRHEVGREEIDVVATRESIHSLSTLLDVLLRILRLDFAYARLKDPLGTVPIEVARFAEYQNLTPLPQEIGQALNPWLEDDPKKWPLLVRNPIGEGDVSIVPLRLGLQNKIGIIVAGSQRADFPAETERLLLRIAANQAAIALQEARAHDELDKLVAERTEKLARAMIVGCVGGCHGPLHCRITDAPLFLIRRIRILFH
jgi:hypothetical protein